jgi:hypothetical protein
MNRILALHILANKYRSFIPSDLRFFHENFICEPIGDSWQRPPYYQDNKRLPLADIMSWMLHVPILSEKAARMFSHSHASVELLPFDEIDNEPYFALNCLTCIDIIDFDRSCDILEFGPIYFRSIPRNVPSIFQCKDSDGTPAGQIFVSFEFAQMIRKSGLTGAEYIDPATEIVKEIARGGL